MTGVIEVETEVNGNSYLAVIPARVSVWSIYEEDEGGGMGFYVFSIEV